MARITLEVPSELSDQLAQVGDRLPELLALSLQQPALLAHIYRYILNFLASNPTPEQIAAFSPTPEMQERLRKKASPPPRRRTHRSRAYGTR